MRFVVMRVAQASLSRKPQVGGGASIYSDLGTKCGETQYGTTYRCNAQFEQSGEQQLGSYCRVVNGRQGITFPYTCNTRCVQPFLEFYEACRDVAPTFGMQLDDLDRFHGVCADTVKNYTPAHGH